MSNEHDAENGSPQAPRAASVSDALIGSKIRQRRKALGVQQEDLAAQLGVSPQQLQKYENGTNRIPASRLHLAAALLGAEVGWFFIGSDVDDKPQPSMIATLLLAFESIDDQSLQRKLIEIARVLANDNDT